MKQLEALNNVERAKLLFDLFPKVIPGFLECTKTIIDKILKDPNSLTKEWTPGFITAGFWISLAKDTAERMDCYNKKLPTSPRLIADQLFDGYNALFSSHCLQQYAASETCPDEKFAQMVAALF